MSVFAASFEPYGAGQKAPIGALAPATIKARLVAYKRNVAKRYRIVAPDQISDRIPEGNLYISTKVDGELWFLVKLQGEVAFCSPTGRVIVGIPACIEAEKQLSGEGDIIVAGELFAVVPKGQRTRVKDCAAALGDGAKAPTLGFKAFDLVSVGEEDAQRWPYADRWQKITTLFNEGRRVAPVMTVEGQADAVHARFDEWVNSGAFEGLVVRSDQGVTHKVKSTFEVDAVILGFGEHRTGDTAEVRELILGLVRDDGSFHVLGTAGSGLTPSDRLAWMRRLEPMVVPSQFRMANSEGTLCRWVRPEIVVELKVFDLMDTDTRDMPIRRMVLNYGADGYVPAGVADFVSLIFPIFQRERPDKPVDPGHVGVAQVFAFLPQEEAEVEKAQAAPGSAVLVRRVWTKAGKGGTAVRKAVAIRTNKQDLGEYPAFVAHFTDYSAGRKEPLQTAIRVAATEGGIRGVVDAWIVENVKKGWEEVR